MALSLKVEVQTWAEDIYTTSNFHFDWQSILRLPWRTGVDSDAKLHITVESWFINPVYNLATYRLTCLLQVRGVANFCVTEAVNDLAGLMYSYRPTEMTNEGNSSAR